MNLYAGRAGKSEVTRHRLYVKNVKTALGDSVASHPKIDHAEGPDDNPLRDADLCSESDD
jgi:hypothetical protein